MPTVRLIVPTTKKLSSLVSEALFAAGAQGLEERAGRGVTFVTYADSKPELTRLWMKTQKLLTELLGKARTPTATFEVDHAESWRSAWTAHLRPVRLTPRLVLAPTTAPAPRLSRTQQLIVYEPALAFGDGDHPTSRLAARAVEAHYRAAKAGALLDIGTGNGVLCFVAVRSGATRALGTDVDAEALRAARQNAALNQLTKQTRFVPASSRVVGAFDVAVVNIELRPLLSVLGQLPAAARRVPKLLVTGFLESQYADVADAVKAAGFQPRRRSRSGEWLLLEARR